MYDAIAVDGTCKFTVFVQKEDRSIVKEDKEIPEDTIWRGKTKDGREARFICYSGFDKKIKPWRPDED